MQIEPVAAKNLVCLAKITAHELRTAVTEKGALQMPLQSSDARERL